MWDFYYDKCHWRNLKNSITLLSFAKVVKMVTAFLWKHFFCAAFNKCLNWRSCSTGCVQNFSNKMISDSALIYYSNKPQIVHHFIYSFPNATSNERTTNGNYTPKQHFTILTCTMSATSLLKLQWLINNTIRKYKIQQLLLVVTYWWNVIYRPLSRAMCRWYHGCKSPRSISIQLRKVVSFDPYFFSFLSRISEINCSFTAPYLVY